MADREINAAINILTDKKSARETLDTLDKAQSAFQGFRIQSQQVEAALNKLRRQRALSTLAQDAASLVSEGKGARAAMIHLQGELVKFGSLSKSEIDTAVRELDRYIKQTERATQKTRSLSEQADDAFGDVSRRVGLFGDIQSNLGAASALTGIQEIGIVGEFAALAEELPRLKTALAGVPAQFGEVIRVLGPGGFALAGAAAGAALAIKLLSDRFNQLTAAAQAQVDLRRDETERRIANEEAIRTRTSEANQQLIETSRRQVRELENEINDFRAREETARARMQQLAADAAAGVASGNITAPIFAIEEFQEAQAEAEKYNEAVQQSSEEFIKASRALNDLITEVGPGIAAREAEEAAIRAQIEAIQGRITAEQQLLMEELTIRQAYNQTSGQIQARVDAIQDEVESTQAAIDAFKGVEDATGTLAPRLSQWQQQINQLRSEQQRLTNEVLPAVRATEAAAEAEKKLAEQRQRITAITEKFNSDQERIAAQASAQLAELERRKQDAIIAIAERAADAAEKALEKLQERRTDLARDLGRDFTDAQRDAQLERLDLQIEYQRDEAKAYREHQRDLARIRRDAEDQELEQIANRDFRSLFFSRRDTTRALTNAAGQFRDEQRERQIAAQQQAQDLATQIQRERQQRLEKYARDLEDAQLAFDREQQTIEANRAKSLLRLERDNQKEINLLRQKQQETLRILRDQVTKELQLQSAAGQQMVELRRRQLQAEAAFLSAGGAFANFGAILGNLFNQMPGRAFGGPLAAGQAARVNEGPRRFPESFNGQLLPSGEGMFIPFRPGMMQAGGNRSVTFNQTNNVSGSSMNEGRIVQLIDRRFNSLVKRTFL